MSIYTYRERLWLYQQMKEPSLYESRFIYQLLKKNDEAFTVNSNGIFFDVESLCDNTLHELMVYYRHLKRRLAE